MSLRGSPIEHTVTLPGGGEVLIRVGVPYDGYIARKELGTVDIELVMDGRHVAVVNTVLTAEQESEARQLAREIAAGLESGKLEPTAGSIEPLADEPR